MKPKSVEQAQSIKLRSQGFSLREISKMLHVSKGSVSIWVRNTPLSTNAQNRLREREKTGGEKGREKTRKHWDLFHKLHPKPLKLSRWPQRSVENFFQTWTNDMAWVLGYFASDGTMFINKRGSHYLAFTSTDKELLEKVKTIMQVTNTIESYQPKGNTKKRYNLQIGGKKLFSSLLYLRFTPRKSLTLKFPPIPDQFFFHFLRGYFDGDGCAAFEQRTRKDKKNQISKKLSIAITSGSKGFLHALQNKIQILANISGGSLHIKNYSDRHPCYDLVYSTQNVLKLYRFMYPSGFELPYLERKKRILDQGIKYLGP